ncbi:hypothetical protein [Okeania sp. SIO1I7]|uniref:hypothetical protein n=1 Tax=Okeania sp. SIO1I7 TaxID=2607772 RepID=UPI0025D11579|nr:hypothetical protein [Okeania sp. SIO1I7]
MDEEKLADFVPDEVTIHVDLGGSRITEGICQHQNSQEKAKRKRIDGARETTK